MTAVARVNQYGETLGLGHVAAQQAGVRPGRVDGGVCHSPTEPPHPKFPHQPCVDKRPNSCDNITVARANDVDRLGLCLTVRRQSDSRSKVQNLSGFVLATVRGA